MIILTTVSHSRNPFETSRSILFSRISPLVILPRGDERKRIFAPRSTGIGRRIVSASNHRNFEDREYTYTIAGYQVVPRNDASTLRSKDPTGVRPYRVSAYLPYIWLAPEYPRCLIEKHATLKKKKRKPAHPARSIVKAR